MKIIFVGIKTTGKVETVWAVVKLNPTTTTVGDYSHNYMIAWGRRNGKLCSLVKYELYSPTWNPFTRTFSKFGMVARLCNAKIKQGYEPIVVLDNDHPVYTSNLPGISPTFIEDLEKLACFQILSYNGDARLSW